MTEINFEATLCGFGGPPVKLCHVEDGRAVRGRAIPRGLAQIYLQACEIEYPTTEWFIEEMSDGTVQQTVRAG